MNFEEYLIAKKIDGQAFSDAEPGRFRSWKAAFEEMHPNSFTVQKLNLINPTRRKYPLKAVAVPSSSKPGDAAAPAPAIKPGKPVIKPKPKIS